MIVIDNSVNLWRELVVENFTFCFTLDSFRNQFSFDLVQGGRLGIIKRLFFGSHEGKKGKKRNRAKEHQKKRIIRLNET